MKTLITLLGRLPKEESGYRRVTYRFSDGTADEAAFLGWVLLRRLRPARLIVIGTATSMWDHVFEGDLDFGDAAERQRLELLEAVSMGKPIDQQLLYELEPVLGEHIGCETKLLIVPAGKRDTGQMEMFRHLAENSLPGSRLLLDCTHGYRHMPMLLLSGAQFLEGLGLARVEAVYYGMLDPESSEATVFRLDGLLDIQAGVRALTAFDASGDYEPVFKFLEPYLPNDFNRDDLARAAYQERILRIPQARRTLKKLHEYLEDARLPFPASLLQPELCARLAWSVRETHHLRQLTAAEIALARRDYMRAVALLFEAEVNRTVHELRLGDPENYDVREQAREHLDDRIRSGEAPRDIVLLRRLRNAISHGVRATGAEAQSILDSEFRLRAFLEGMVRQLR